MTRVQVALYINVKHNGDVGAEVEKARDPKSDGRNVIERSDIIK